MIQLFVVLLSVLVISGCGDIFKIMNVKKMDISCVTYKHDFVTVNEQAVRRLVRLCPKIYED